MKKDACIKKMGVYITILFYFRLKRNGLDPKEKEVYMLNKGNVHNNFYFISDLKETG